MSPSISQAQEKPSQLNRQVTQSQKHKKNATSLGITLMDIDVGDITQALSGDVKKAADEVQTRFPAAQMYLGYSRLAIDKDFQLHLGARLMVLHPFLLGDADDDGTITPTGLPSLAYDVRAQMHMYSLPLTITATKQFYAKPLRVSVGFSVAGGPSYFSSQVDYSLIPKEELYQKIMQAQGEDGSGNITLSGWGAMLHYDIFLSLGLSFIDLSAGVGQAHSWYQAKVQGDGFDEPFADDIKMQSESLAYRLSLQVEF